MIDDQLVLRVERLRDEVESLKSTLHDNYSSPGKSVTSDAFRKQAISIAERWLVEVAGSPIVVLAIGDSKVADRSVHFQRLLTYAERNTVRKKYDQTLKSILSDFRSDVIVPLKASRNIGEAPSPPTATPLNAKRSLREFKTAFIGQSFSPSDKTVNEAIQRLFTALGLKILTGERPRADSVSKKVMDRINQSEIFIGVFTRRDKIENKAMWNTSAWIIDEKAFSIAKNKKLILLREQNVNSIGGLHGDFEYLEFDRDNLSDLLIRIVEVYMSND